MKKPELKLDSKIASLFLPSNSQNKKEKIDGISVVIPFRGFERFTTLVFCIDHILRQNVDPIEIIVSEEDSCSRINMMKYAKDTRVKHILTFSHEKFNKSKAINVGVINAKYNKIIMNDVDIIVPNGYLLEISQKLDEYESCFLAKEIYYLTRLPFGYHFFWREQKRSDYFSGGSIAFTKDAFFRIGGMCELFKGYGSEDCEFWTRIQSLTKMNEDRKTTLLHAPHKRYINFSQNTYVYNEWMSSEINDRVDKLQDVLKKSYNVKIENNKNEL